MKENSKNSIYSLYTFPSPVALPPHHPGNSKSAILVAPSIEYYENEEEIHNLSWNRQTDPNYIVAGRIQSDAGTSHPFQYTWETLEGITKTVAPAHPKPKSRIGCSPARLKLTMKESCKDSPCVVVSPRPGRAALRAPIPLRVPCSHPVGRCRCWACHHHHWAGACRSPPSCCCCCCLSMLRMNEDQNVCYSYWWLRPTILLEHLCRVEHCVVHCEQN